MLRVSCKVYVKPERETIQASIILQETQSIHDSMNIPRIEFISKIKAMNNSKGTDRAAMSHDEVMRKVFS